MGRVDHLLFMDDLKLYGKNERQVDTLVHTVRVFSEDIGMQFGINKCAVLIMKKGKMTKCEGIKMPYGSLIRNIDEGDIYKYLGILEADDVKHKEMKEKMRTEYFRRVRKILKSKLNSSNMIQAINSRAVSLIKYGAGIIKWTVEELKEVDRKTKKPASPSRYRQIVLKGHWQQKISTFYIKVFDLNR